MPVYLTPPPGNPLTRALAAVVGLVMLIGAFMVGMVAFLIAIGVSVLAGTWLWIRTWRLRRQIKEELRAQPAAKREDDAIEGEYRVVSRDVPPEQ